jgi:hypothetical protein
MYVLGYWPYRLRNVGVGNALRSKPYGINVYRIGLL